MKHRILSMGLAAISAIGMRCLVFGEDVPAQFVVSGKAAERIHDFTTINLATAQRIAETCEGLVTARGGLHSIIILDHEGNRVYMDRMDGQGYTNVVTPEMKARTALVTGQPSKAVMNRVARDPSREAYEVQLGLYPVAGGLPILVDNHLIGAAGGGGYRPDPPVWSDEICVRTAMVQVFGPSVPPLLEDVKTPEADNNRRHAPVPSFGATMPPKSSLPAEFVVTGGGAAHVFDGNQISLAAAKKIGRACRDWAASKGATMSLYVLDNAGEMVHMERMDGQVSTDIRTALLKAQTALRLREPTSIRGTQLKNEPRELPRNTDPNMFNFFLEPGGIPIVVGGQMIGAVGVSGVDGGQDENCAIAGLKSTFGDKVIVPVYPK